MELAQVTVGQLRAELAGWPDAAPAVVFVPSVRDPLTCAVLPLASAGVADHSDAAAVLGVYFPLTVSAPSAD